MEYESRYFNSATRLTFSLAAVTDALVERALRKAQPLPAAGAAAVSAYPSGNAEGASRASTSSGSSSGEEEFKRGGDDGKGGRAFSTLTASLSALGGGGMEWFPATGRPGEEEWAAESHRIEAGEILSRRALTSLQVRSRQWTSESCMYFIF